MSRNISRKDAKEGAKALSFLGRFASAFAPLRETALFTLFWLLVFAGVVSAQKNSLDPNKFAVIIDGAGGEETYAHQFEQWTEQLRSSLAERFGFDRRNIRVLS